MLHTRTTIRCIVAMAAALATSAALAHPTLLSSTPADQSEVPAPATIELTFSEKLVQTFSNAHLVMTGTDSDAKKVGTRVSASRDGRTLIVTPAQALQTGHYRLEWRVVASDTHPVDGRLTFRVK